MTLAQIDLPSTSAPSATPPSHPGLTFLQPVPRALVHRSAIAEVFVTGGLRRDAGAFAVAAQWPRDHALYHPDGLGLSDPLLFAETIRQSLLYVAHSYFDEPAGSHFIGQSLDFDITDFAPLRVGATPLSVVLDVDWAWEERRKGRSTVRLGVSVSVDGEPCGAGGLRALVVDDRRYSLLRSRSAAARTPVTAVYEDPSETRVAPPEQVGRLRWKDCVLERATAHTPWRLRLDPGHAVLFDHPTDHVPLMALLEGFRQLGHLTLHGVEGAGAPPRYALAGCALECLAFAELDEPVELRLDEPDSSLPGGGTVLRITAVQGERPVARADMLWQPVSAGSLDH